MKVQCHAFYKQPKDFLRGVFRLFPFSELPIRNANMKEIFESYLFGKHLLVGDAAAPANDSAFETVFSLANLFGIRILSGHELVNPHHIRVASREIGIDVPEPFYQFFPKSVRRLTLRHKMFDQLFDLFLRLGWGITQPGHPLFEERFARLAFRENFETKDFRIISEEEAIREILACVDALLCSTRPVREDQYQLILNAVQEYHHTPARCACKDTAIKLILDTGNDDFADFITLPDVIKLTEILIDQKYRDASVEPADRYDRWINWNHKKFRPVAINNLRLRNPDRKLIARILDRKLAQGRADIADCFERRKHWKGLLHHIHYQPRTEEGMRFVKAMREGNNQSTYARMEAALKAEHIPEAVDILVKEKGVGALLRRLTYLLSRCVTAEEIEYIAQHMVTDNILLLIQMLPTFDYYNHSRSHRRTFKFIRFEKLRVHQETPQEVAKRKSYLPEETITSIPFMLRKALEQSCRNRLGKVYVDSEMLHRALPIQEAGRSGGYGVYSAGSVILLSKRSIVRLFSYWNAECSFCLCYELLDENGVRCGILHPLCHSGSSNEKEGSEYVDVDIQKTHSDTPWARYVLAYAMPRYHYYYDSEQDNTKQSESERDFRAGYMLRDRVFSGEVFEPKTVPTNIRVNLKENNTVYLFALDLETGNLIMLNVQVESDGYSGMKSKDFLVPYLRTQQSMNVYDLFCLMARELVDDPMEADVVVSDDQTIEHREDAVIIRSTDSDKLIALLNPSHR